MTRHCSHRSRRGLALGLTSLLATLVSLGSLAGCDSVVAADGRETITIDGRRFRCELAADDASRTRGLMGRQSLGEDEGMLFVFPAARVRSFWMANCLIDIDILFLDPRGRVTAMHHMKAEPPKGDDETQAQYEARLSHYWSNYPAQFAIELQAGMLEKLHVAIEDKIELDLERLKALAK